MLSNNSARTLAIGSVFIGVIVFTLKVLAYLYTGSIALYSDALESIVNIAASIIALAAIYFGAKPADNKHPYGHQKIEYIAAVFEGALILIASIAVFHAAFEAYNNPKEVVLTYLGVGLNIISSFINAFWAFLLIKRGKAIRSPALVADGQHIMTDVYSSCGVVLALFIVFWTKIAWLDPAIACLVALNILWSGWSLMQSSFSSLMDEAPPQDEVEKIRSIIRDHAIGAIEAHDLRMRHAGKTTFIEFHLVVPGEMRVDSAHDICDRIEAALKEEMQNNSVTIHIEPENKAKHHGIIVL